MSHRAVAQILIAFEELRDARFLETLFALDLDPLQTFPGLLQNTHDGSGCSKLEQSLSIAL